MMLHMVLQTPCDVIYGCMPLYICQWKPFIIRLKKKCFKPLKQAACLYLSFTECTCQWNSTQKTIRAPVLMMSLINASAIVF